MEVWDEAGFSHQTFGHWTTTIIVCFFFNNNLFKWYFKTSDGLDVSTQIVLKKEIQQPTWQKFSIKNKACKNEEAASISDPGAQRRHQSRVL